MQNNNVGFHQVKIEQTINNFNTQSSMDHDNFSESDKLGKNETWPPFQV